MSGHFSRALQRPLFWPETCETPQKTFQLAAVVKDVMQNVHCLESLKTISKRWKHRRTFDVIAYLRTALPLNVSSCNFPWQHTSEWLLELITFEILAAERLRLMGFDNRLIIDCFANVVNILIWLFSTNDRFRSEKYESNYLENPFPEMKGVNLLSKTHRNDKSNLKPMTVLQE